jgi:hypothetical protein
MEKPIEIINQSGQQQKITPGKGYPITRKGKRGYVVYDTKGQGKFTEYPKPKPKDGRLDSPIAGPGPEGNRVGSRPAPQPPAPAVQPPAPRPLPAPATQPPVARTAPAPRPAPQPKIEKSPAGYALGSVGGVKFERRAATRAELDAAQAARKAAQEAGKSKAEAEKSAISAGVSASKKPVKEETMKYDAYDLVLEYLFSQGHVDTLEEALYVMMEMDAEMIGDIVEDGFNSSGRYDVGGGRTVGPVAGAIRSLVTGNLPKSKTYVPPSKQTATNRPPATPASKGDSGKLTDFGAGGGRAKLKQGMTVGQVERQGRMNKGDYSG